MTSARRPAWLLAAFSAPCLPLAALGLPLVVHLPAFYAETVGLNLGLVGAVFLIVRLIDIGVDPLLGGAMDRTSTRFGRFRPWLAASAPVLFIATWMLFAPPKGAGPVFLTVWLLVIYVGFSVAALAQSAWAAALSPDYDERARVYGWWQAGNVVGILLVLLLPVIVTARGGDQAMGVWAMALFIMISLPITLALAFWRVPEPVAAGGGAHAKLADYVRFFHTDAVRRLMICDLMFGLAPGVTGALALFYFKAAKGMDAGQANVLIFLYFAAGLIGAPVWSWSATRLGKHRAMTLAGLIYAAAYVTVGLAPKGNFPALSVTMLLVGVTFSAAPVLLRAMMADVGDEDRLARGEDRTGMLYALLTATNKIGYAVAAAITYFPLAWVGFNQAPGATNSPVAIATLHGLFIGLPIVMLLLGSWIIHGFPIDEARQSAVREALAAKGLEGKA